MRSACVAAGSRNLSDFTRTELLALVQTDGHGSGIERKFLDIDRRLSDLHDLVQRVSETVIAANPATTNG